MLNELGRRHIQFGHVLNLRGFEARRATEELLAVAWERVGRPRENALRMLLKLRGEMTDVEHARYASLVYSGEDGGLQQALLRSDQLLRKPRLSPEEREKLEGVLRYWRDRESPTG